MTVAYCDPNSDVAYTWSDDAANDYARVNDAVRSPTSPATSGDGELCHAGPNDDNEEAAFGVTEPISSGTVSQIVLYAYMVSTSGVGVELRVKLNGAWQSAGTVSVDTTGTWHTKTYSGSWNAATDIFPMQVGIKPLTIGKSDDVDVYAAYVDLTYTAGPPPPPVEEIFPYSMFPPVYVPPPIEMVPY